MSLVQTIADSATRVVEAPSTLHYRIQRPTTADVARFGVAQLALLPEILSEAARGASVFEELQAKQAEGTLDPADPLLAEAARLIRRIPAAKQAQMSAHQDALICAAVREVSADGEIWEPLKVVPSEDRADPGAGVLSVSQLPQSDHGALTGAIQDLIAGVEVMESLRSFRSLTGDAPGAEPDPAPQRDPTARDREAPPARPEPAPALRPAC